MKITINSTSKIVYVNEGTRVRIWEGETENGVKMHAYIVLVACDKDEPRQEEFQKELQSHVAPSPEVEAISLRMII